LCTKHPQSCIASSQILADFVIGSGVAAKQKPRKRPESGGGTKLCVVARVALKQELSHALPV